MHQASVPWTGWRWRASWHGCPPATRRPSSHGSWSWTPGYPTSSRMRRDAGPSPSAPFSATWAPQISPKSPMGRRWVFWDGILGIDSKESIPTAYVAWVRICKRLWSPEIESEESIQLAYVAWRAGTTNRVVVPARQAGNRFLGSLKGLQIRALAFQYENPIPTRFLAPVDCSKILALNCSFWRLKSWWDEGWGVDVVAGCCRSWLAVD